jgi:uncharacterized protein YndB with AHSA1/START domain
MSRTVLYTSATPEDVFAVLLDPSAYPYWVVGAKKLRQVEDGWPAAGSGFHHSVGVGPLATRDETRIVRIDPPRLLELDAHGWPAGQARVTLRLEGNRDRTRVEMIEEPTEGPARWLHNPLLDAAAHARNTVSLRRLARLAEGRR